MAGSVRDVMLPADPRSSALARRFVEATLTAWGRADNDGVVALLVSELVTNALLHARSEVCVRVTRRDDRVRVAVEDSGGGRPRRRGHSAGSATGRGLDLVESLASDWGVDPKTEGKSVWFEVPWQSQDDGAGTSLRSG